VPGLIDKLGLTASAMALAVDRELERLPKVTGAVDTSKIYVTQAVNDVLTKAEDEAKSLKDEFVSVEHLLLGLIEVAKPDALKKLFKSFDLDRAKVLKTLKEIRGNQRVTTDNPEATYQALEKYGIDLIAQARKGKMDPVIGRDEEIRRTIRRSSRARTKNNPVLIGEPGVGKTAIVEGLAQRIVRGDVPEGLKDKTIFALDMGALDRRREVPRRVRRAPEGRPERGRSRPTAASSSSSTSCTPSSAPARPRARWTPATCSSPRSRAASCTASARPRSTSTASTSRRTPRSSAASSRSSSDEPTRRGRDLHPARPQGALRAAPRRAHPGQRPRRRRRRSRTATSPTASCPTRPSTSWTRPARMIRTEIDSHAAGARRTRRASVMQLEIEETALAEGKGRRVSKRRLDALRARTRRSPRRSPRASRLHWEKEKASRPGDPQAA